MVGTTRYDMNGVDFYLLWYDYLYIVVSLIMV